MTVVVFCGPTLNEEDRAPYAHFLFRPPVRQGELYAAASKAPRAIGVIDGYFDGVPAVWHKEILWALTAGIAVFGSSSMGALRAAELHMFGMRGVGRIFEAYCDGTLTDDDEVALLHGPAETGYFRLSEPMVNIRATLERALSEGVLDGPAEGAIASAAKAQFYQDRTWKSVLADAAARLPGAALTRFEAWLAHGKVDQKREDALLLLGSISEFVSQDGQAELPAFSFEWTETWANAPWRNAPREPHDEPAGAQEAILDELRLQGEAYLRVRWETLLRWLSKDEIARAGLQPDRKEVLREVAKFRSLRGLMRQEDVHRWVAENDFDATRFEQLVADRAGLEKLARERDADLHSHMLDQLRQEDSYVELRERARAKARLRSSAGGGRGARIPPPVLVSWYFGTRLGTAVPDDLADYVATIGLADLDRFYALLAIEYALSADGTEPERSGTRQK
jgi:hypothetical protein